jgi:hypothetical protein
MVNAMAQLLLKLKQASAASCIPPKDLQNFVQAGVLKPRKKADLYYFDSDLLLQAKVAWHLRETLGVSTESLTRIVHALSRLPSLNRNADVVITSRLKTDAASVQIRVPFAHLNRELEQHLPLACAVRDLPRGRKRPGWKQAFVRSLEMASTELGPLSRNEILRTVRDYRKKRKPVPEIRVLAETPKKAA